MTYLSRVQATQLGTDERGITMLEVTVLLGVLVILSAAVAPAVPRRWDDRNAHDVLDAMAADAHLSLAALRVDGGAALNNFLMQFQADILNVPVERPTSVETTAWGAAALAGVAVGLFDLDALTGLRQVDAVFEPGMDDAERSNLFGGWKRAVGAARAWVEA